LLCGESIGGFHASESSLAPSPRAEEEELEEEEQEMEYDRALL
jgi:hypothetical protein